MKTSGCEGLHHGEVLLAHSADKRVEECVTERKVIALSAYDAQRSVGGIQDHYVLKDFETWTGYFAPGKLMIKVLNIAFSNYPIFQVVFEEQVKFHKEKFLLDKEEAEFEVQKRLVDADMDLWMEMCIEVWKRGGKELTISLLLQDLIRKCLDHWALYNLPVETTDKLTKLIHHSYQRKFSRYGTGYFDGGRNRVMMSMLPTTLWATRFQRTSMLAAEIMMATWPYVSSYKTFKTTVSANFSRFAKGTLLAHSIRKLWWVTKRGVFHLVLWGGSALGTSIIGAYWYPCNVKVLDNLGILVGALAGEAIASGICNTLDGFLEPVLIDDIEDKPAAIS